MDMLIKVVIDLEKIKNKFTLHLPIYNTIY